MKTCCVSSSRMMLAVVALLSILMVTPTCAFPLVDLKCIQNLMDASQCMAGSSSPPPSPACCRSIRKTLAPASQVHCTRDDNKCERCLCMGLRYRSFTQLNRSLLVDRIQLCNICNINKESGDEYLSRICPDHWREDQVGGPSAENDDAHQDEDEDF